MSSIVGSFELLRCWILIDLRGLGRERLMRSLRVSTLTYFMVVVIVAWLAVDTRRASAGLHDYENLADGDVPESVFGLWREAEQSDTYIYILGGMSRSRIHDILSSGSGLTPSNRLGRVTPMITIYRRNNLSPDNNIASDERCYIDGPPKMGFLHRTGPDRYFIDPLSRPPRSIRIDLIVKDDPDVMWAVLTPGSFLSDTEVRYVRERERELGELPICN